MDLVGQKRNRLYSYLMYAIGPLIFSWLLLQFKLVGLDVHNHIQAMHSFNSIIQHVDGMYLTWSSRIFVNTIMFALEGLPYWFFVFLTGILFYFSIVAMTRWYNREDNLRLANLTFLTSLLIPFYYLVTAGWIDTTVTYLYPFFFIIIGLTLLYQYDSLWTSLLGFVFMLVGFNNEQLLVEGLVCAVSYLVFCWLMERDYSKLNFSFVGFALIINSLIVGLCPGNRARAVSEIKREFPQFSNLNFLNKIDIGVNTTFHHYWFMGSLVLVCLSVILVILINRYHIYSWFLLLIQFALGYIVFNRPKPFQFMFKEDQRGLMFSTPELKWFTACLLLSTSVLLVICLYQAHHKLEYLWAELTLLVAGLITRIALGFSPTNYASSTRTFTFLTASFVGIILLVILDNFKLKKWQRYAIIITLVVFIIANIAITYMVGLQIQLPSFLAYAINVM